jgi:hypothetical protein
MRREDSERRLHTACRQRPPLQPCHVSFLCSYHMSSSSLSVLGQSARPGPGSNPPSDEADNGLEAIKAIRRRLSASSPLETETDSTTRLGYELMRVAGDASFRKRAGQLNSEQALEVLEVLQKVRRLDWPMSILTSLTSPLQSGSILLRTATSSDQMRSIYALIWRLEPSSCLLRFTSQASASTLRRPERAGSASYTRVCSRGSLLQSSSLRYISELRHRSR